MPYQGVYAMNQRAGITKMQTGPASITVVHRKFALLRSGIVRARTLL